MMFVMGMAVGIVLVATCSTKRGSLVKDAAASPAITASCNQLAVQVATSSAGTQTTTSYYAEIDPPGLDPMSAPTINAVACDFQYFGGSVDGLAPACPAGDTCTSSGYVPPAAAVPCVAAAYARIGSGKIVVYCGGKTEVTYTATPANNYTLGSTATTVYVSVN
jgi:hypothetical protein